MNTGAVRNNKKSGVNNKKTVIDNKKQILLKKTTLRKRLFFQYTDCRKMLEK